MKTDRIQKLESLLSGYHAVGVSLEFMLIDLGAPMRMIERMSSERLDNCRRINEYFGLMHHQTTKES